MKVAIVVSSPMTVEVFLRDQVTKLSEEYDITVVANLAQYPGILQLGDNVSIRDIRIERKVSPWNDLKACLSLLRFFREERIDVVHSVTPKAGLLAMGAASVARVPNRLHTFTGQVWATMSGMSRAFYKLMDKCIFMLATQVYVDSHSQRKYLLDEHVITAPKSSVLLNGSISGVDVERFSACAETRSGIRNKLKIHDSSIVYLFIGRLNPDKGVTDLAYAFSRLVEEGNDVVLLMVGPDEGGLRGRINSIAKGAESSMHFVDYTDRPEDYMNAADILCLPSYREGFGSVVIEAAAVGIPTVGSRIYGISDAVVDGETGLLHTAGDVEDIYMKMKLLIDNKDKIKIMAKAAHERALRLFSMELLSTALMDEYSKLSGNA